MTAVAAMCIRLIRICSALLALAILTLSVVPPGLRPVVAGQDTEHFFIFFALGASVGLAYPGRWVAASFALFWFAGGVEVAQLFAPGRHARLEDFVVDFLGSVAGIVLIMVVHAVVRRLMQRARRGRRDEEPSDAAEPTGA